MEHDDDIPFPTPQVAETRRFELPTDAEDRAIARAARDAGLVVDGKLDAHAVRVTIALLDLMRHASYAHSIQSWTLDPRHIEIVSDQHTRTKLKDLFGRIERESAARSAAEAAKGGGDAQG